MKLLILLLCISTSLVSFAGTKKQVMLGPIISAPGNQSNLLSCEALNWPARFIDTAEITLLPQQKRLLGINPDHHFVIAIPKQGEAEKICDLLGRRTYLTAVYSYNHIWADLFVEQFQNGKQKTEMAILRFQILKNDKNFEKQTLEFRSVLVLEQ